MEPWQEASTSARALDDPPSSSFASSLNSNQHNVRTYSRKGKERAVARDESSGSGGQAGVVLPMEMVGSGVFQAIYTVPIRVGSNKQQFSVQVDTGSSDLWIASSSCSTQSCGQAGGRLYDPSGSAPTGVDFSINYLSGNVSGPIVWDEVEIGGYSISSQALSPANNVVAEPLTSSFSGILGLALPLNSIIASLIPAGVNNNPDGQTLTANLFSISPASSAPSSRFFSLTLSRPGSPYPPALLGLGQHPAAIAQLHEGGDTAKAMDLARVRYAPVVSEAAGSLFWKARVVGVTVWVDGAPRVVDLAAVGRGAGERLGPTAVLDSGVPIILATSAIANAIYGAIGVGPAADGQYYVPCTTPLNMSITLDDRPPLALHPLDLTAQPATDPMARTCVGLIQAADSALAAPGSVIGSLILGVPFLRSTYTVFAFDPPDAAGRLPANNGTMPLRPRLGLLGLTDPGVAMAEFTRVRVERKPLASPGAGAGTGADAGAGGKLAVGVIVLVGLLSFFALCFALFGLRWVVMRRRMRRAGLDAGGERGGGVGVGGDGSGSGGGKKEAAYQLARRGSGSASSGSADFALAPGAGVLALARDGKVALSEDEMRTLRYEAYRARTQARAKIDSEYSVSSGRTLAGEGEGEGGRKGSGDGKAGYGDGKDGDGDEMVSSGCVPDAHSAAPDAEVWDAATGLDWGASHVPGPGHGHGHEYAHARAYGHARGGSTAVPLLSAIEPDPHDYPHAHAHDYAHDVYPYASPREAADVRLAEFGVRPRAGAGAAAAAGTEAGVADLDVDASASANADETLVGMAGVGTAARARSSAFGLPALDASPSLTLASARGAYADGGWADGDAASVSTKVGTLGSPRPPSIAAGAGWTQPENRTAGGEADLART